MGEDDFCTAKEGTEDDVEVGGGTRPIPYHIRPWVRELQHRDADRSPSTC